MHGQRSVTNEEEWALWCFAGELSLTDVTQVAWSLTNHNCKVTFQTMVMTTMIFATCWMEMCQWSIWKVLHCFWMVHQQMLPLLSVWYCRQFLTIDQLWSDNLLYFENTKLGSIFIQITYQCFLWSSNTNKISNNNHNNILFPNIISDCFQLFQYACMLMSVACWDLIVVLLMGGQILLFECEISWHKSQVFVPVRIQHVAENCL